MTGNYTVRDKMHVIFLNEAIRNCNCYIRFHRKYIWIFVK